MVVGSNNVDLTVAPLRSSRQKRCGQIQLLLGVGELITIFVFGSTVVKWDSMIYAVLTSTCIGFSLYTVAGTLAVNASKVTRHHRWVSACLAFSVLSAIHTVFQICICATVASPVQQSGSIVTTWGIAAAGMLSVVELCVSSVQMLECCNMMDKFFEYKESSTAPPTYEEIYMSTTSGSISDVNYNTSAGGVAGVPPSGSYVSSAANSKIVGEPPPSYDEFLKYLQQPKLNPPGRTQNEPADSGGNQSTDTVPATTSPTTAS